MLSPYTFISEKIANAFQWKEFQSTADWCSENILISSEVSGRSGYLSFEKYPWSKEILDDWDRDNLEEYSMWASTQVAKTTTQFCCIVKPLATDPCMIMFVMASDKMVSDFVSEKFDPFVDGINCLKELMAVKQAEDSLRLKNAIKIVPGGRASFVGNTAINRRGKTVKYVFMDEVALYNHSDVEEFKSRTKSFEGLGRKIFIVSSSMYPTDPIQTAYRDAYCKKELHIICDQCETSFYPTATRFKYMSEKEFKEKNNNLEFSDNQYKREAIKTARVTCDCGHNIYYKDLERYVREDRVKLITVEGDAEVDTKIGYKLNALATGLTHYEKIAEKLIEAGLDENKLAGIFREYFNEIYEGEDKSIEVTDVALLGNNYEEFIIPDDTAALYMGIDTQKGYYWVTIVAFEYGMSPQLVWAGRVDDEETIESFMDRRYYYSNGKPYTGGIKRAGQDWQGYRESKENFNDDTGEVTTEVVMDMPQRVKEFAYKMSEKYGADKDGRERFYATRGEEFLTNDEYYRYANTDVTVSNFRDERKIKTLRLGTTALKSAFMSTLMRSIAKVKATENDDAYTYSTRLFGINKTQADKLKTREKFHHRDIDMQLTAEKFGYHKTKSGKIKDYKSWGKIRNDNHYLDCMVICYALAIMDNIASLTKPEKREKESSIINSIKNMI